MTDQNSASGRATSAEQVATFGEDAVFSFSDGSTLTLAHVQASSLTQAGEWGWG